MAQFTLKIKTYDPIIVNAFMRLRKSRKQSAYTHEALRFFLASEQGVQVMDLMARDEQPGQTKTESTKGELLDVQPKAPPVKPASPERNELQHGESSEGYCAAVLGNILK